MSTDTVTKADLVALLNEKVDAADGGRLIDALIDSVMTEVLQGKQVVLDDFATIKIVEKRAQSGHIDDGFEHGGHTRTSLPLE